jgi:hypothetical protein
MAREATPVLALAAIVLGIVAAIANGDGWWFLAGVMGSLFLVESRIEAR